MTEADRLELEDIDRRCYLAQDQARDAADRSAATKLWLESRRCREIGEGIRARLLNALAAERGWIVASRNFTLVDLATQTRANPRRFQSLFPLIDHAEHFREPKRPWRPSALLSHSYEMDRHKHLALAREHGLALEFLDWSWYLTKPDKCLAALYIRM